MVCSRHGPGAGGGSAPGPQRAEARTTSRPSLATAGHLNAAQDLRQRDLLGRDRQRGDPVRRSEAVNKQPAITATTIALLLETEVTQWGKNRVCSTHFSALVEIPDSRPA